MTKYAKQLAAASKVISAKGTTWNLSRRQQTVDAATGTSVVRTTHTQTLAGVLLPVTPSERRGATIRAQEKLLISGEYEWTPEIGDIVTRAGTAIDYTIERVGPLAPDGVDLLVELYIVR